ncbi:DNA excision repair protein ERCC-6 [Phytophthora pseudosyringae]|uniref:DNA excision repair protein ERCC-6 n=1 Tax=Phytophthora pseudosyringae TaxID=221518 RepID=A0A8T1VBS5_9STRA|nr:DNA excision repair protein ERCC-6 [Phytophthora pseudosyringae]
MNRKDDPDGAEIERCWGKSTVLFAARSGHYEMVRWLCENTLEEEEKGQGTYDDIIEHALNIGDDDLVKFMLPPGKCVLDYAEDCPRVEVIELMLACGYLHRDAKAAMKAIAHLAGSGEYLELMQQIAQLHSPLREDCSKWIHISSNYWVWWWYAASGNACTRGGLAPVQWLIEHPIGIGMCELIKYYRKSSDLIRDAAWHGHWNIVQYLCQQKITEDYNGPLQYAISNGQLECVEILIQQFVHEERQPMFSPIELAAKYGRLEVVRFLDNCKPQAPLADQRHPDIFARQACAAAVKQVFRSGPLRVASWLRTHFPELSPVDINDVEDTSRVDEFEMLLFLDAHCPQRIDRVFAEDVRRFILEHGVSWKKPIDHMFNWLKAKGATEDTSQTN